MPISDWFRPSGGDVRGDGNDDAAFEYVCEWIISFLQSALELYATMSEN